MLRRVLYLAAALLPLFEVYVGFHPDHGTVSRSWPWDLVRDGFAWDQPRALAATRLLLAGSSLLLACLRPSKGRGYAALVLGGVALAMRGDDAALSVVAVAITAGAVLALRGGGADGATRWLLAAGLALLATRFLLPASEDDGTPLVRLWETGLDARNLALAAVVLLFATGLVALLGIRGRWAGVAALVSLAVLVLGVPLRAALEALPKGAPESLQAPAEALATYGSAVMALVVAALIDARTAAPLVR